MLQNVPSDLGRVLLTRFQHVKPLKLWSPLPVIKILHAHLYTMPKLPIKFHKKNPSNLFAGGIITQIHFTNAQVCMYSVTCLNSLTLLHKLLDYSDFGLVRFHCTIIYKLLCICGLGKRKKTSDYLFFYYNVNMYNSCYSGILIE